jgi:hypothetical protein
MDGNTCSGLAYESIKESPKIKSNVSSQNVVILKILFSIKCVLALDMADLFWTLYLEFLYEFSSYYRDPIKWFEILILWFQPTLWNCDPLSIP